MPKFDVHVYIKARVKFAGVEAETMEEACAKAARNDRAWAVLQDYVVDLSAPGVAEVEIYPEAIVEYLVDVVGGDTDTDTRRFDADKVPFKCGDPDVRVEVRGGVAEVTRQRPGLTVEILDHDDQEEEAQSENNPS